MSLRADVEALARALGVWRDGGGAPPAERRHLGEQWVIWPAMWTGVDECKFWMRWWRPLAPGVGHLSGWSTEREQGPVDAPTLALILLGHARGLRVDIGECPACCGSREEVKTTGHVGEPGWTLRLSETVAVEMWRHCPACAIDGKPTGRHTLAWERAILDAMPKRAAKRNAHGIDHAVPASWCSNGVTPPPGITSERGPGDTEVWVKPGDPATRTALTVLADQAQASGDKFGDVLAWWLAGSDVLGQHDAELCHEVYRAGVMPSAYLLGHVGPGV